MQQPPYGQYPQGAYPQQPPPPKKGMSTCLIIAIVCAVLAVPMLGIMATLGLYGVRRYLANAKSAEARNNVGAIARDAVAAYESDTSGKHRLCGSATPVPATIPKATKYQPAPADFQSGDANTGWACLKFSVSSPIYYQYDYVKGAGTGKSGATANGFEATARGDLNGDGVSSLFARGGDVRGGNLVLSSQLYVENEFE